MQNIRNKTTKSKKGKRVWMLPHEMDAKFTPEIAADMRRHKQNDDKLSKEEIRPHPQLPQKEACE